MLQKTIFFYSEMDGAVVSSDWVGGLNITYKTGPGYSDKRYVKTSLIINKLSDYRQAGSHMSAPIVLNLLNELRKSDKMRACPVFKKKEPHQFYWK